MKKTLKWIGIVAAALIVIGILVPKSKSDTTSESAATTNSDAATSTEKIVKTGDVLHTDYFDVQVNNAVAKNSVNTGNPYTDLKPEAGNQYIVLDITLKNTDKESRLMTDGTLLVNQNGNMVKYENAETVLADGYGLLDNINPGVTKTTKIIYKVPADLKGTVYYHPARADEDAKIEVMTL